MAGDWIKMQKSLPRDPRVVRISSALKADRLRIVGGLLSAWCLFDEQTEDGMLPGYTPELMDEIVGFPGLALAMSSVNWLEIGDGFLAVPRFDEHNGQSAKRRAQDSLRKTSSRKADKCPHEKRTKSGPEKRREEIKEREIGAVGLCTLDQAKSYAGMVKLTESEAEHWWNTRNASGWTKGGAGGAQRTKITSWQSDMASSASWAKEGASKRSNGQHKGMIENIPLV